MKVVNGSGNGVFTDESVDFSDFDSNDFGHDKEEYYPSVETRKMPNKEWPFPINDVDTRLPPGFVGEVADWIDSQCRYERRNLCVASAIVSVGNIAGLRHTDARDDVTANMMAFCVSASATGKEAVQQAMAKIHRVAGCAGAMQGAIKSEQEIMRNLLDHQAAFYVVDEIGIFLTKVRNAQQRGGATYLEGVFGALMSAYSKANSFLLLGGDTKRDLQKTYGPMLARADDEGNTVLAERAKKMLDQIDGGIERPFLSVVGFTTPSTFDRSMDGATATQGFVGRSIIVVEKDINPKARKGFKKAPMTDQMKARLGNLYAGGSFDIMAGSRVECSGDIVSVETTDEASDMLQLCSDWLIEYADEMGEYTGEASVAIVRRSYEMIAKISFILALNTGTRTAEHVRWAMRYVREEVDGKIALVFANDNEKNRPEDAIGAKIMAKLDHNKGITLSVLSNGLRSSKDILKPILTKMQDRGMVKEEIGTRKYRGELVTVWLRAD